MCWDRPSSIRMKGSPSDDVRKPEVWMSICSPGRAVSTTNPAKGFSNFTSNAMYQLSSPAQLPAKSGWRKFAGISIENMLATQRSAGHGIKNHGDPRFRQVGKFSLGVPRSTFLSTNSSCQPEKLENSQLKSRGSAATPGVVRAAPKNLPSNRRKRGTRENLWNVGDKGEASGARCCQQNMRLELG